ncbi:MAG TPA: dihydroorotate dehydrogenase, partial [Clostridia bacterium]|nr:dihydroorotate dehydrogenase [Clostridia bacterium]
MTTIKLFDKTLKNPVIAASGTFGFGREYQNYMDLSELGGISSKGLTWKKRKGNKGQRIYETASGMMNSIGLQNPSVLGFIKEELPFMLSLDTYILANLGGSTIEDYVRGAAELDATAIDAIELNISCPNVKEGGMAFGIRCHDAKAVVEAVRPFTTKPLIVKLSPNAEDIQAMAYTCAQAGADGLSLVNTFNALAIDIENRKPVFDNITAGLSGPCIKPIALRMVRDVALSVDLPIIGLGGISSWQDAIEFIMAGARAIQVGTANFYDPLATKKIIEGIKDFMQKEGIKDLEEIRGI